jgi:pyruvate dehydrogenase E1 component beta subunit
MTIKPGAIALKEAMAESMRRDPNVFVMGEDIRAGVFMATTGLVEEFGPERIINTPLSEVILAGATVGAAVQGLRPVLEIMFADCLTISADHIINSASKMNYLSDGKTPCPMVIRAAQGYGLKLGMHHSQCAESWFANVPGLKIIAPFTPYDAKGLLISAIEDNNPVVFLEHKKFYASKGEVPDGYYKIPIGKADVKRPGKDVTIVSYSIMMQDVLQVAEDLAKDGIDAEVIDLRTIRPLDVETITESVKKTGRLIIVHEAPKFGGFGGEIAASIAESAFNYLKKPIIRLGGKECPVPFGVETAVLPKHSEIAAAAKSLVAK